MSISKIRMLTQAVLPTVYDESLSYSELIQKCVCICNALVDEWDSVSPNVSAFIRKDGTIAMEAALNMGGFKVTALATPTANTDAATKAYVDSNTIPLYTIKQSGGSYVLDGGATCAAVIAAFPKCFVVNSDDNEAFIPFTDGTNVVFARFTVASNKVTVKTVTFNSDETITVNNSTQVVDFSSFVSKSGSTMTGNLDMGSNYIENVSTPSLGAQAANKTYVDEKTAYYVLKSGETTMTGALNMGAQRITNVGTPTSDDDAATKEYVDSAAESIKVYAVSYSSGSFSVPSGTYTALATTFSKAQLLYGGSYYKAKQSLSGVYYFNRMLVDADDREVVEQTFTIGANDVVSFNTATVSAEGTPLIYTVNSSTETATCNYDYDDIDIALLKRGAYMVIDNNMVMYASCGISSGYIGVKADYIINLSEDVTINHYYINHSSSDVLTLTVGSNAIYTSGNISDYLKKASVTIAIADWSSGTSVTKTVSGMTAAAHVVAMLKPSASSGISGFACTGQGTDYLTFSASATPTSAVTVDILYWS